MSETRLLTKAPIREAVIDIQVTPPVSLEDLKKIAGVLLDKPNNQEVIWQASLGFDFTEEGKSSSSANRTPIGYKYTFTNKPYVMQCRVNGFSFSHLPPYGNWEEMSVVAKELWEIYLSISRPQSISRIAVRYINSMPIPLPIGDFGEYLNVPPIVPDGLPQTLASFLQRYVIVDNGTGTVAVVTQVLEEQQPQASKITLLLDIDVFRTFISRPAITSEIWATLEELRNYKNRVFFKYVTDKTLRMFE